jgi:hypothetical protein
MAHEPQNLTDKQLYNHTVIMNEDKFKDDLKNEYDEPKYVGTMQQFSEAINRFVK